MPVPLILVELIVLEVAIYQYRFKIVIRSKSFVFHQIRYQYRYQIPLQIVIKFVIKINTIFTLHITITTITLHTTNNCIAIEFRVRILF